MLKRILRRRKMLAENCRYWGRSNRVKASFLARIRLGIPPHRRFPLLRYDRFHARNAENKSYRAFGWGLTDEEVF